MKREWFSLKKYEWHDYDPAWLVKAAEQVLEEYPWLQEQLKKCTRARAESKYYIHFVDPRNPNEPGSEWQFLENIALGNTSYGEVVLDVLVGNRIGGVEFTTRLHRDNMLPWVR